MRVSWVFVGVACAACSGSSGGVPMTTPDASVDAQEDVSVGTEDASSDEDVAPNEPADVGSADAWKAPVDAAMDADRRVIDAGGVDADAGVPTSCSQPPYACPSNEFCDGRTFTCQRGDGGTCSTQADCLPTDYCDGLNCRPKLGSGIPCANPSECNSGFCDNAVCCDADCSLTPGGNCNKTAALAGKCTCDACANGPCAVFYRDADGDGYGDPAATSVACAAATVTGYVTNNTDCDDGDAKAHPGQTAYFSTFSLGKGTYDYNCNGSLEKEFPQYPQGTTDCSLCLLGAGAPAGFSGSLGCGLHGTWIDCALCADSGADAGAHPSDMSCH